MKLRALLEGQGVTVVGIATSSGEAVRSVQELRPDKLIASSPAVGLLAKTELSAERIYQLLDRPDT